MHHYQNVDDYVVETYYSLFFIMAIWFFYIHSVGVYVTILTMTTFDVVDCSESFGCELLNRVWSWAAFALILTAGGIIIIGPISVANDPYEIRWN
jgi:hypothetical protein